MQFASGGNIILSSEKQSCSLNRMDDKKISINDFLLLKSLASGAYGNVILSRKKNTKDMFAIKVLDIQKMKSKNCVDTVLNERNILNKLNSNFIVKGVYTFKSNKYLYMVMEYLKGGDLATLLEEAGYFNQEMAKFYLAQLVLALE
jgi:serine/threonine protein kinase